MRLLTTCITRTAAWREVEKNDVNDFRCAYNWNDDQSSTSSSQRGNSAGYQQSPHQDRPKEATPDQNHPDQPRLLTPQSRPQPILSDVNSPPDKTRPSESFPPQARSEKCPEKKHNENDRAKVIEIPVTLEEVLLGVKKRVKITQNIYNEIGEMTRVEETILSVEIKPGCPSGGRIRPASGAHAQSSLGSKQRYFQHAGDEAPVVHQEWSSSILHG